MPNDDMSIRQQPSPLPTADSEGVDQVTTRSTVSAPPAMAAQVPAAASVLTSVGGGPALEMPQGMNPADLMTILYALQKKLNESRVKDAETNVHIRADDKKAKNEDIINKLKKITHNKPNKSGLIAAKVFAWVGVALAFVVAGVVAVVSGGLAAAPLFALAAISAGILIAQETGGFDKMCDAMGMDDKQKMAFSIALSVTMLVLNLGATVATGGASAVSSIASTISSLAADSAEVAAEGAAAGAETAAATAETAASASEGAAAAAETTATVSTDSTEVASGLTETTTEAAESGTQEGVSEADKVAQEAGRSAKVMRNANRFRGAVQVASGSTMVAGGSIQIDTAKKEYNTTIARSDTVHDKAELAKLMALDEEDMQRIRKIIEQLQKSSGIIIQSLSDAEETSLQIRRNPI